MRYKAVAVFWGSEANLVLGRRRGDSSSGWRLGVRSSRPCCSTGRITASTGRTGRSGREATRPIAEESSLTTKSTKEDGGFRCASPTLPASVFRFRCSVFRRMVGYVPTCVGTAPTLPAGHLRPRSVTGKAHIKSSGTRPVVEECE